MNSTFTCSSCGAITRKVSELTSHLFCKQCGNYLSANNIDVRNNSLLLSDWSPVQISSSIEIEKREATIIGRVRIQLQNDYKNFWCATFKDGTYVWLLHSFASFAVLRTDWKRYGKSIKSLHARSEVTLQKDLKLRGEFVEKCDDLSFEGEIGNWKMFQPGFFMVQCGNAKSQTAVFVISGKEHLEYLEGLKIEVDKLNLKNFVVWNDWK
jgi:RNase P subunit RPR2